MGSGTIYDTLAAEGYAVLLRGGSALDAYLGCVPLPFVWVETDADISVLARCFEDLRYPGVELADAALDREEGTYYFFCLDSEDRRPFGGGAQRRSFTILEWKLDCRSGRYHDPGGLYPLVRELRDGPGWHENSVLPEPGPPAPWWESLAARTRRYRALMDAALILARYSGGPSGERSGEGIPPAALFRPGSREELPPDPAPGKEEQRVLLVSLLLSPRPGAALDFLKENGFVGEIWPELEALAEVDHSKEFHPEGNVWDHTLETLRYRKSTGRETVPDLRLSLGLLLHDLGKPLAASSGSHRFDGHAELGARAARKFLERLEFSSPLIEDIFYLVKNHMLPAALPRLPLQRTGEIMESPLFPTLMELYRCDESSSFKGLEGYYQSSAAYQSFLRYRRNPYRSADGKKLGAKTR